jgi:predicted Zn finger-like uncharacterized protein
MTITCPKCRAKLKLSDDKARAEGTRVRCSKCGAVLVYKGKARKEVSERGKPPVAAVQPPVSGEIPASQGAAAAEDLSGKERAAEIPPAGGQEPIGTPNSGPIPQWPRATMAALEPGSVSSPVGGEGKGRVPGRAVMAGSAVGVLILLVIAVFIFRSPETPPQKQQTTVPQAREETPSQPPVQAPPQESPPGAPPEAPPPAVVPAEVDSSATPEEKAIGMVKRSDVLLKMTSVEAIVDKWTQDNAGKYKVVGWQAKKIDDQQYLVSYTALEGSAPKGFYFVANLQSGTVEDLAHNPELQKKYNIQYN